MRPSRIIPAIAALSAAVLLGPAVARGAAPKEPRAKTHAPSASVQTLEGASLDLADAVRGKPTMLIFWATWCPSCRRETPAFKEAHRRFATKGLNVVAVDIGIRDSVAAVRDFVKENGLPYRVLFDPRQEAVDSYRVAATPTVLLLDAGGEVVSRSNRVEFDAIEALLAGRPMAAPPG